ncbi:hypothetical protein CJ030_MR5G010178 [Morella rubra]|uniref:Uncharacterized protein n=1 Tax=Morella rubra TaxID=262757 RepID=A0A6A1VM38_9ROSI|nr:hypothetical protein CJ030_MR5G010178 [Morella rubra]
MAPFGNKGCATVQKQFGWLTPMKESDLSVYDNQVNVNQPILNRNVRVKANPRRPSESIRNFACKEANPPRRSSESNGNSARKEANPQRPSESNGNSTNPQRPSAYNGNSARKGKGNDVRQSVPRFRLLDSTINDDETEGPDYDTPAPDIDDTEIAGLKADLQRINEQPLEQPKRKGRGPAKGTEFDKLRKLAKIPLSVKENSRGDSTRANPPDDISAAAWDKLCDIWQSEEYQKMCKKNAVNRNKLKINHTSGSKSLHLLRLEKREEDGTTIEFYKRSRIHKDGTWVCQEALQIYQKMIELQKERDPDQKHEAIAEEIFTEVLGRKSGYVRGMGKSMIPPPVSESRSAKVAQMSNQIDKYKSELEYYKNAYEGLTNEVKVLNEHCNDYARRYASYDEKLQYLYKQLPSDNQNETDGDETE